MKQQPTSLTSMLLNVLLIPCVLLLAACSPPWTPAPPPALDTIFLVDPTGVGIDPAMVQGVIARETPRPLAAGKSVSLCVLDGRGARCLTTFTPTKPASDARKVVDLHLKEMQRDCDRLLSAVLPRVFADIPKSSQIAAAILTVTAGRSAPVELILLTDGREASSVWNTERGNLPDAETWTGRLVKLGYSTDCLKGVRIRILGMPLIAPADPDPSPRRGLALRDLWRVLSIEFGASTVTFEDDHAGAMFLVLPFAAGFRWRKFKAGRMGKGDAKDGVEYHPLRAVECLIGPKPLDQFNDPEVAEAEETIERERPNIAMLRQKIGGLRSTIARQPNYWLRIVGITALLVMDGTATAMMLHDLGTPSPHDVIFGIGTAGTLIGLAGLAGKATKINGKKPTWWWVSIGATVLVTVSLTGVRVATAPATGDPYVVALATAIVQGMGVVGPPLLCEMLFEQLRPVMPNVKDLSDSKNQLREAEKVYKKAFQFLALKARLRQAWEHESTILGAIYTRAFLSAGGRIPPDSGAGPVPLPPPPPPPGGAGGTLSAPNGGLPVWPS